MIGRALRGSGFGGLTSYLTARQERVAWMAVRNLPVEDPELVPAIMQATALQSERVRKPVYHLILSAAPDDQVDRRTWERIADRVLNDIGLGRHQAMIVAHNDTDAPHVHVMVNRVHHDEKLEVWKGSHDYRAIEQALRRIELDLGLTRVPGRHSSDRAPQTAELTPGELRQRRHRGERPTAEQMREQLRPHFREATSWADLEARIEPLGYRLRARGRGLVVTDGERLVKASRIDRSTSLPKLEERFGMSWRAWREERGKLETVAGRLTHLEARRSRLAAERTRAAQEQRAWREYSQFLGRAYEADSVDQVAQRIWGVVRQQGHARAASMLERSPERLGPLRSGGGWAARDAAGEAAQRLRTLESLRGRSATSDPVSSARRFRRLSGILDRLTRGRLPSLSHELARAALRWGAPAVLRLIPHPAAQAVRVALRSLALAREAGRHL